MRSVFLTKADELEIHKDLSERLPMYNRTLYLQVKDILDENKAQRHIRGGIATRRKYKGV
jgi:putative DeoR family transcriptional regulator (stage III sporulation protein D)